ncbi:hypothetical protein [Desulfobotulus sp.]|uniref:hypothetical protein n=1 Tax=Desulfobotulus sp. TaxID=1940337 RepID=UPI002A35DFD5|nr:hypothetical protein [Desulfobotulus sp.]MDY0164629.1 hypothetical protein [Desulfobotulus sp.]
MKITDDLWDTPPSVDAALEKAAEFLPKGYRIAIFVEKGGYAVELEFPDGRSEPMDGDDGIRSDIMEGVRVAHGITEEKWV